jgi:hypothetical protein
MGVQLVLCEQFSPVILLFGVDIFAVYTLNNFD